MATASGWTGAGLLGLVLYWLLFHYLPAKDRQIEKLAAEKDVLVKEIVHDFREESMEVRTANAKALDRVCLEFEREMKRLKDEA